MWTTPVVLKAWRWINLSTVRMDFSYQLNDYLHWMKKSDKQLVEIVRSHPFQKYIFSNKLHFISETRRSVQIPLQLLWWCNSILSFQKKIKKTSQWGGSTYISFCSISCFYSVSYTKHEKNIPRIRLLPMQSISSMVRPLPFSRQQPTGYYQLLQVVSLQGRCLRLYYGHYFT